MAGKVEAQTIVIDTGAVSVKSVSAENEGSFLSMAAPVSLGALDGFENFQIKDPNSFRLEIIGTNSEGRFDYGNRKAWVLGEMASYEQTVMYTERNMNRFSSELYIPFVAGALRVAFPTYRHTLEEVKKSNWLIDKRWATPVRLTASIAPGYFGLSNLIKETLQNRYIAFVDMSTKGVYVFFIEDVDVIPESFGSFQFCLYDIPEKGTVVPPNFVVPRNVNADKLERAVVTVLDFGGRTLDWMTWQGRKIVPNRYGSEMIGFNDAVDAIASEVFQRNAGKFAYKPSRMDILRAMRVGGKMSLVGIGGEKILINDFVTSHMNNFTTRAESVWRNQLDSGQGIHVLILAGGAAIDAMPYLDKKIVHAKRRFVSLKKNHYDMYMGNAVGGFLYASKGTGL